MTRIWDRLYVGNFGDAEGLNTNNPHEITGVINCTKERIEYKPRTLIDSLMLNWDDGTPLPQYAFEQAMSAIVRWMASGRSVLVHCHAGCSRSVALTTAYLYRTGFKEFDDCLAYIVERRPIAQPSSVCLRSVKEHLGIWPYSEKWM